MNNEVMPTLFYIFACVAMLIALIKIDTTIANTSILFLIIAKQYKVKQ